MNNDGYISNGDLFNCLKVLVGDNLTDIQIQQLTTNINNKNQEISNQSLEIQKLVRVLCFTRN